MNSSQEFKYKKINNNNNIFLTVCSSPCSCSNTFIYKKKSYDQELVNTSTRVRLEHDSVAVSWFSNAILGSMTWTIERPKVKRSFHPLLEAARAGFTFSLTPSSAAWWQTQQHVQILQMTAVHVSLATMFSVKMYMKPTLSPIKRWNWASRDSPVSNFPREANFSLNDLHALSRKWIGSCCVTFLISERVVRYWHYKV